MPARVFLLPLIASGLWVTLHPRPAVGQAPGSQRPVVAWSVERRDLPARGWRHRAAVGHGGTVWVGTDLPPDKEGGGLLHRREGSTWSSLRILPPETQRTFILDTDPEGGLWMAPLHPELDSRHPRSSYRTGIRIQHYDGRRWREESAPGFWPQAMDMVSPQEGWIGGNHGQLLHRSAGRWKLEKLPGNASQLAGKNILALEMRSPDEGWAAGTEGLVAHWKDGHWRILRVPSPLAHERFLDLDVTEEDGHLWLAGTNGVIARFDGMHWTQILRPTIFDLMGIDMVSPSDGWAVGEKGTLLRFDGTTWSPQPTPVPGVCLRDIVMTSAQEGWIVGDQVVLHAHGEPASWQAPRFQDQSRWAGYSMAGKPSEGAAVLDVDADGDLDLFSAGEGGLRLFLQEGPRRFSESSRLPLLAASPQENMSVKAWAWGDVEGDGDRDLVLWGAPFGLQILRNAGRGAFTAKPLRSEVRPEARDTVFFLDLDRDGQMDLHLARGQWLPNWIYHNRGGGRFELSSQAIDGDLEDPTALWGDLDGDLDPDALLTGESNRLVFLRNDETGELHDDSKGSGLRLPLSWDRTFQGILVDLDRDGDLDVLLLGSELVAFINDGNARFRRGLNLFPELANNPHHGGFLTAGDLNHDGFPELLVQTIRDNQVALRLLSRDPASRTYRDITNGSGLEGLAGTNAVFADLDGDGDLDLFLARREGSLVLENLQNDTNFLKIHLYGDRGNRAAAGAHVRVYEAGRRDGRSLRGYQQMGTGFTPLAQQNLSELHFGLDGGLDRPDERRRYDVEVLFPSGRQVIERGLLPGRTVEIFESPPGIRQGVLILRWVQRAWLSANRPLEIAKLLVVILALALLRGPVARRFEARLLLHRWSLAAALLLAYLVLAGELAGERRAAPHVLQLLGFCGALALFAGLDARLSRWKYQRFLGPFILEKTLGQGGMGIVHRARHALTGQIVALKVLHPRWIEREDHRLHFLREAQVLIRFEHPNIVRVFETGAIGDRGYISMELLKGMPLSSHIQREGPLSPEIVIELLLAACDALIHVHAAGYVHGDVKSANLFLLDPDDLAPSVAQGWRPRVKLMDFGLAQRIGAEAVALPASLGGTPAYMSPEQLQRRPLDARSDLYSLGAVAYEALTGQLPFEGDREGSLPLRIQAGQFTPLRQRRPDVSSALDRTVAKMLAVSRDDRPPSAAALSAELRALRRNDDPGTLPVVTPSREPSWEEAATWQNLFREAKIGLAKGRITEGQVLMLECLAVLGETLQDLSKDDREAYCQRHEEIAAALELHRRLSQRQGMQL